MCICVCTCIYLGIYIYIYIYIHVYYVNMYIYWNIYIYIYLFIYIYIYIPISYIYIYCLYRLYQTLFNKKTEISFFFCVQDYSFNTITEENINCIFYSLYFFFLPLSNYILN